LAARLPDARPGSGAAVALLDEIRRGDPDEPFWRGVRAQEPEPAGVRLEFNEPVDPALRDVGPVRVACHLHDPRFAALATPVETP
jgi:hypothetical protein